MANDVNSPRAMVKYLDQTEAIGCPYGNVRRVVTGGEGGISNVHVVTVSFGSPHVHTGYDEVYYVLSGTGSIAFGHETHPLRPGAVVVIPRGIAHALEADEGQELEFVIFGTPPMPIEDERARPRKP